MNDTMISGKVSAPVIAPENRPYWEAANEGRLLIKHCRACDQLHSYPRGICPLCFSPDTDWIPASGHGTIYSYTMAAGSSPTLPAYIRLEEGVTLLSTLVGCTPAQVQIGSRVAVAFLNAENGQAVPVFCLAATL